MRLALAELALEREEREEALDQAVSRAHREASRPARWRQLDRHLDRAAQAIAAHEAQRTS